MTAPALAGPQAEHARRFLVARVLSSTFLWWPAAQDPTSPTYREQAGGPDPVRYVLMVPVRPGEAAPRLALHVQVWKELSP